MGRVPSTEWLERVPRVTGTVVCAVAALVLLDSIFEVPALKLVLPETPKMAPLTALTLGLGGFALLCAVIGWIRCTRTCATLMIIIGFLRLGEYMAGWNLRWDEALSLGAMLPTGPVRMAPITALGYCLLGGALWLSSSTQHSRTFQVLTLLGGFMGWLGFAQHLMGDAPVRPYTRMALHAAVAFAALSAGVLALRRDAVLVALLVSKSAGGVLARHLLPAALLVPLIVAWLNLQGQRAGWFGPEAGLALVALVNVLVFAVLVWATASMLDRADIERQRAEQAAQSSHKLMQGIADNSPAVIYVKDLQGRYLLVNRRYEQLFHIRPEEMVGKTDYDVFPNELAAAFRAVDEQVLRSGTVVEAEEVAPHNDGLHTYISIKYPLTGSSGELHGVCGISTDITERKRAEQALRESQERYRLLSEAAPLLVWTSRPDGEFDYVNPRWVEYTGLSTQDQVGRAWLERVHPDDRLGVIRSWSISIQQQHPFDTEFRLLGKNGEYRWFKSRATAMCDETSRITKWFGANTDIDDLKRAQEQVTALNETLEQRVRDRTRQLEEANQELEAFSYSVSHDLRAPLRRINGFASILQQDYSGQLPPSAGELLHRIGRAAAQMSQLIEALLNLSRVGRIRLRREDVDLAKLAMSLVEEFRSSEPNRIVHFVLSESMPVIGDPELLRTLLVNLIGNAWKFTRQQERAQIEVGRVERQGTPIYYVRDNGAGFDPSGADRLFQPFHRLHHERQYEGTGIGLATVSRIIHRHGGTIWAEGQPERGACFYFTLE